MLKRYRFGGGDHVKAGFYWNVREWAATIAPREGAVLAGGAEARYLRIPLPLLLVLAPLMGAAYAMFLPFIGFAMVAMYLAGLVKRMFTTKPPAEQPGAHKHAA